MKLLRRPDRIGDEKVIGLGLSSSLLWQMAGASFAINLLSLITPVYFTQVYDRVLSSRSEATLLAITAVTLVVVGLLSAFDLLRNLICARASAKLYTELERDVFAASRRAALMGGSGRRTRALEDLELFRSFWAGPLPAAMFDLAFAPLFVIALFLIHEAIGALSLAVGIAVLALTLANRASMAKVTDDAVEGFRRSSDFAEAYLRGVEPAMAMGYAARAESTAKEMSRNAILRQMQAVATTGGATSLTKGIRSASQILVIALAAYLALAGSISMGAIIAASILFSRALSPLDQVMGAWRSLFQALSAWRRLAKLIENAPPEPNAMPLPDPTGALAVQGAEVYAPGSRQAIVKGISFEVAAGEALGIVGPSGSGKSTLARALVGVWPAARGVIRLDGADIAQLDLCAVGRHIGYVPQAIELLPGSIAENIRRFGPDEPSDVVAAARASGAHEMILALPQGYDTVIGGPGFALSGGQRQRIGLARALYGAPALLVLDEPDSALDREGEMALDAALAAARKRGATIVMIAHRPSHFVHFDKLLVLIGGRVSRFGKPGEILPQLVPPAPDRQVRA